MYDLKMLETFGYAIWYLYLVEYVRQKGADSQDQLMGQKCLSVTTCHDNISLESGLMTRRHVLSDGRTDHIEVTSYHHVRSRARVLHDVDDGDGIVRDFTSKISLASRLRKKIDKFGALSAASSIQPNKQKELCYNFKENNRRNISVRVLETSNHNKNINKNKISEHTFYG